MSNLYHAWNCFSGCGITTLMNKFLKGKRVYCANCGTKSEMVYIGEVTITNKPQVKNKLGRVQNERITTN
jgi:hypothetical protein